ncbi:Protein N-acetyltransferase, RimJ/RimL family [Arthrobacter alpinus]|uniref:Lysine N-acyltransferase MbtK n=1 Tax=Arthrobacter alpinus TaxID=656366 RepID=A0A1H5JL75_9MICC|nr:GNAT family N-acetyltransferase [Arthrobacter alpinus]SEE53220.1 Protein N-acetyltransferase, RimJ/RimL family [Arthrobacter alpinus]
MRFSFRPVNPAADAPLLHSWVGMDYARFWGMQSATLAEVRAEYENIQSSGHHTAILGMEDGNPVFLMESYDPTRSPLHGLYDAEAGDIGMHLLVAPPLRPRPGFTTAVMSAVLDTLFADPTVERVVVEPDATNHKIHILNARLGFRKHALVRLPDKEAWLSLCTRENFRDAALLPTTQTASEGAIR